MKYFLHFVNKYFLVCYQSGVGPEDVELRDAGVGVAVVLQVLQQQGEGGEEEAEYEGHLGIILYLLINCTFGGHLPH